MTIHETHFNSQCDPADMVEFMKLVRQSGALAFCKSYEVWNTAITYTAEGDEIVEQHVQRSDRRRAA